MKNLLQGQSCVLVKTVAKQQITTNFKSDYQWKPSLSKLFFLDSMMIIGETAHVKLVSKLHVPALLESLTIAEVDKRSESPRQMHSVKLSRLCPSTLTTMVGYKPTNQNLPICRALTILYKQCQY